VDTRSDVEASLGELWRRFFRLRSCSRIQRCLACWATDLLFVVMAGLMLTMRYSKRRRASQLRSARLVAAVAEFGSLSHTAPPPEQHASMPKPKNSDRSLTESETGSTHHLRMSWTGALTVWPKDPTPLNAPTAPTFQA